MAEVQTYLGDGLYARFDGHTLTLCAPREHGDQWVALEPEMIVKLLRFLRRPSCYGLQFEALLAEAAD